MRERCLDALLLLLFILLGVKVEARSFGVIGEVFPVAEKSLLQLITERLASLNQSEQWDILQQQWIKTVTTLADKPTPLGLTRASRPSIHYYKPEFIVSQAITDGDGHLLYPLGTRINALEALPSYQPCWFFFNADDQAQLHWAQQTLKQCTNSKLILTGGSVSQAEKRLQQVIYFDQAGRISQTLHIKTLPAQVKREGNQLRIEELMIKEDGHVA